MKKVSMLLVLLLLVSTPVFAEERGIHGEVSFKYELDNQYPGESWKIDIYYTFNSLFSIGVLEITGTDGYIMYFNCVPGFIPDSQIYEFYLKFDLGNNITLKIAQWCNHPVWSNQNNMRTEIYEGVYFQASYKF